MSLHFLDPDREPRECPRCKDHSDVRKWCVLCKGTGRLGVEGAKPEISVRRVVTGWRWQYSTHYCRPSAKAWPTEADALAAARRANKGDN